VTGGGLLFNAPGGLVQNATIENGGVLLDGGLVQNATIKNGGALIAASGGACAALRSLTKR
jgi:hypothetical protein